MPTPWYRHAVRRAVVDMHITDHDERFLSRFDAASYVNMLRLAQAESVVLYAHSHVGLCYFPTQIGPMHSGLKGRDLVREVADLCHENDIAVVVYLSAIFDTEAYRTHPDWRIIDSAGHEAAAHSRYGICCPNSPYRDYIAGLAAEVARRYRVEGVRFDMTFWPRVCYCPHCERRVAEEVGGPLPRTIDWLDPGWVAFQRRREAWLIDFASLLTRTVREANPELTVEHQASTFTAGWQLGVTTGLAGQCDFLQGDFYGDALQGSVVRKLFLHLSENLPYGFETCVSVDLGNYTTLKSRELLTAKACASLADGGAFIFIDSIDPLGTLNRAAYERMGRVFDEVKPYQRYLGGTPVHDVAVYLSTESKCDFADNGRPVDGGLTGKMPHIDAALSACRSLLDEHTPFGVISRPNLANLSRHQVIILPNVLMMDAEEVRAFRDYVHAGGSLYASKWTSLVTTSGQRQPDFLLADVFGASFRGETKESFTYVAPVPGHEDLLPGYTAEHPAGLYGTQFVVEPRPGAQVLGRIALPYTDPADPSRFASIHNNPPGTVTDHPAILLHSFGSGKCLYVTGDLEAADPHRSIFLNLLRLLARPFSFEADAPKPVEVTLFHQEDRRRYLISLLNFQKDLPNIPVEGVRVRVRLTGQRPSRLLLLPEERPLALRKAGDCVEFTAPRLDTLLVLALEYA